MKTEFSYNIIYYTESKYAFIKFGLVMHIYFSKHGALQNIRLLQPLFPASIKQYIHNMYKFTYIYSYKKGK